MYLHYLRPQATPVIGARLSTIWEYSRFWANKLQGVEAGNYTLDASQVDLARRLSSAGYPHGRRFLLECNYRYDLLSEYIFEDVRRHTSPDRPSRRQCLFLFDEALDYRVYSRNLGIKLGIRPLVRVVPIAGNSTTHRARLSLLNCNTLAPSEIVERASEYWKGIDTEDLDSEVLLTGECEIIEVVRKGAL